MKFRLLLAGFLLAGFITTTASAQLAPYSTDFTSTATAYPTAPDGLFIGDGWTFFHTQPPFPGPGGSYFGDAPNGPQICALAEFDMNQYINVYSDYNNVDNRNNFPQFPFENYVFQEQTFSPADAASGDTWTFTFDWKHADSGAPSGSTTTAAYIRVFDGASNLLEEQTFDTTTENASFPGFDPGSVSVTMDPVWNTGGFIQFGFTSTTISFEGSGVFYDNVNFASGGPPVATPLSTFCSDFEDLVPGPRFSPIGDGWLFFHTQQIGCCYNGDAPQGPQISNLADELGDPGSSLGQTEIVDKMEVPVDPEGGGNKYLNIYSDYDNPQRPTFPTFDFVNNVFQEQTFTAADAAKAQTYTFSFEYAGAGGVGPFAPFGVAENPNSTAAAFIRVFDGAFNPLAAAEFDTSGAPTTPVGPSPTIVFQDGKVSLTMDPAWVEGGIIQFGFTTTSSLFEQTGVYYDDVCFAVLGDANNDGEFNNLDIASFVLALTSLPAYQAAFPEVDPNGVLDMNCDGVFDNTDIADFVSALTGGTK